MGPGCPTMRTWLKKGRSMVTTELRWRKGDFLLIIILWWGWVVLAKIWWWNDRKYPKLKCQSVYVARGVYASLWAMMFAGRKADVPSKLLFLLLDPILTVGPTNMQSSSTMEVQRISWPVHPTVFHLQWSGGIGRLILSWAKTTLIVVCVLLISFLLHFVLAEWRTVWPADWLLAECMELPWSIIHVSLQHKSGIHFILIALFDGLKRCCFLERHFYEPKFGQHAELKRERYFRGKTASTCLLKLLVNVLSLK